MRLLFLGSVAEQQFHEVIKKAEREKLVLLGLGHNKGRAAESSRRAACLDTNDRTF